MTFAEDFLTKCAVCLIHLTQEQQLEGLRRCSSHRPKFLAPIVREILLLEARKLTEEERLHLQRLRLQRQQEIQDATPILQCCEEAKRYPVISFVLLDWELPPHPARWFIMRYDSALERVDPIRSSERPVPKFCPFCMAPVPAMRRKAEPPRDMFTVGNGSDRCGTCFVHPPDCLCLPPEAAYEPVV